MADNMIKIYGALEAATEEGIVTYSESIYDRNRAKKLDEILSEVQTSVIPNPEIVGTPTDLIALKINNVIYKIKDVGAIILTGSSTLIVDIIPCSSNNPKTVWFKADSNSFGISWLPIME